MKYILLLSILAFIYNAKWYPKVTGYDETNFNNGFAGDLKNPIVGVRIDGNIRFRVHIKGKGWQKETTSTGGDMKNVIDGIAIYGKTYKVYANNQWLPPVNGYNINDPNNGYAGILGYEIYGLMIKGAKYQVAVGSNPPPSNKCGVQNWVSYGTGLKDVSTQMDLGLTWGCYFMAACVKGGLGNNNCILDAKRWAAAQGYIRDSDTLLNVDGSTLALYISQHYGTTYHNNWSIVEGCGHYWVNNENGKEIFNSAGLGWSGC